MAFETETPEKLLFLTGLYSRVARQLGVHPSYVSRVARGERRSDRVHQAIAAELGKLRGGKQTRLDAESLGSNLQEIRTMRHKLAQKMKSDPRLRRLSVVIIEAGEQHVLQNPPRRIPPARLSAKVAANSRMIAGAIGAFERLSLRLERFPHVLSLLDSEAVVLYSAGTTGMARKVFRVPGSDWSRDYTTPSAAARCLAAGVPVVVISNFESDLGQIPPVKMACPVRLSDNFVTGVVVLTIDMVCARIEHMIELSKISKRLCKFVENGSMDAPVRSDRSNRIQPFADAARHVAMVLSLPQIDPHTRVALSGMLAQLEANAGAYERRDAAPKRKSAVVKARGAS